MTPPDSQQPRPPGNRERQAYERLQRHVRAQMGRMRRLAAPRRAARP